MDYVTFATDDFSDYAQQTTISKTSIKDYSKYTNPLNLIGKFHGITYSDMGHSKKGANAFFKLKEIAMNPEIHLEDRMNAVRYMHNIPHKHMLQNTLEAAKSIIDDDRYPIHERFFFFSNHEKFIKLDKYLVSELHAHFFYKYKERKYPLILYILSAQYIYGSFLHSNPAWNDARNFIITLAQDKNETYHIRAEAADILCRHGDEKIGRPVIDELGNLYITNRLTSLYSNAQNVHDNTLQESVINILHNLISTVNTEKSLHKPPDDPIGFSSQSLKTDNIVSHSGDVHDFLINHSISPYSDKDKRDKILEVFHHILTYPSKFEGLTLTDILSLVWTKIKQQSPTVQDELKRRFLEEMHDMEKTCGTGMVSRFMNIFSGYLSDDFSLKINVADQLRSNIFSKIHVNLRFMSEMDQGKILDEISDDFSDKATAKEFLEIHPVKEELEKEFVNTKLVSGDEFLRIYNRAINDFLGQNEDIIDEPCLN